MAGWWTASTLMDCNVGSISQVMFENDELTEVMEFRTEKNIQNESIVWRCIKNNVFPSWIDALFTFEIMQDGKHSRLVFVQNSDDLIYSPRHPDYEGTLAGWEHFMESLKQYCETGAGYPWSKT